METSRIGGLPTPHGIDRLSHERRDRHGKGSFQDAFEKQGGEHAKEQGAEQGQQPGREQGHSPHTPRPTGTPARESDGGVQDSGGNGRREDEDGVRHVDVLA